MKYKSLYYIPLLAIAVMSSCTNDNEMNSTNSEYVNSVRVTVEDFQPETTTRTAYTVDNSGFHFQWIDGDALGIYPVGGDQVKFPISNGDGSATATFDGGAWKLRSEYQYAAYYPFSANNYTVSESALSASFTGQTQNGNGSTAHLGAYDYLACAATAPDANGGVDLTMKHLGAFLRLQLTMPKADTFSSVVLESDGAEFVTAGTFDLTAATPAITPTTTSSTYTINLTNVATTEKNQVITVYAIVAPANLITSNITVTVHGTGQTTYVQTVPGKNFAARSAYNIAIDNFPSGTNASGEDVSWDRGLSGVENGHDWVDLGLTSGTLWATMNVGAASVTEKGDFFSWGEIAPKATRTYTVNNCKYWEATEISNGYKITITKYTKLNSSGQNVFNNYTATPIDNQLTLLPEDDAATQNWGGHWRTPTREQIDELRSECSFEAVTVNKVEVVKVTGPNGKYIYLPFTNMEYGTYGQTFYQDGQRGYYWSNSLYDWCIGAYCLKMEKGSTLKGWDCWLRSYGCCVRPVCY